MGYSIVRIAKRRSRSAVRGMLQHALRETAVANALPGAPAPERLAGERTSGAALARLAAALKDAPTIRKDTIQAVDVLITASHEDLAKWPKAQQDAYFREVLDLVAARFGGAQNVLCAAIHRDETTPHLQALIMPRDPATGRFQGVKMIGGPAGLRALQDEVHERVGKRYGLLRGEKGTKAEHVPIRRFYAALQAGDRPLPAYVEMPPAPTLTQKALGQAAEIEAARKKAQEHNRRVRAELVARAKAAAQIHPAQMARQADRYRASVRAAELAKLEAADAQRDRIEAERERAQARDELIQAAAERAVVESFVQHVEQQKLLVVADEIGRNAGPHYVARLSAALGVELRPGRSLIDQTRKALGITGQGAGLQALQRLDDAAEALGLDTLTNAALRAPGATSETVTPRHRG